MKIDKINNSLQVYFSCFDSSNEFKEVLSITPIGERIELKRYTDGARLMQYPFALIIKNSRLSTDEKEMNSFKEKLVFWIEEKLDKHAYPNIEGIQSLEMIDSDYVEMINQKDQGIAFRLTHLEKGGINHGTISNKR